jgi:hypothetical protein
VQPPPRTRRPTPPAPGTVLVHSVGDAVTMPPKEGRELVFGRNRPEVHLCVGEDDLSVSRKHGTLTYAAGRWWLRNTGLLTIRIGESRRLAAHDEPVPLADGYTSLVVEGARGRLHLVEVLVVGPEVGVRPRHGDQTRPVRAWDLQPEERLAVVVLAQDYLRNNPGAQPATWQDAAKLMARLDPGRKWTDKKVEHRVRALRLRLAACGVYGVIQPEVGGSGDALKHNLIKELIATHTISSKDLELIDGGGAAAGA